jgi:hypothetical protein
MFGLAKHNPRYGQSDKEELHQPLDRLGIWPNLNYPWAGLLDTTELLQSMDWLVFPLYYLWGGGGGLSGGG